MPPGKSVVRWRRPELPAAYNLGMTRRIALLFCTLAACAFWPQTARAQQVDLSPGFEIDQPQRFRVESESVVTRSMPDLDQELTQTTKLTYFITRRISRIEADRVEAQLRFDRVMLETQAPNLLGELEDVVYDTGLRDPESGEVRGRAVLGRGEFVAEQYADVLDPLLGVAISITLDRAGDIREVRIPESFGEADLFSVEMIRDRFSPLFQIHPDGGLVDLGSQWEQSSEQDSGLGFDVVSLTKWTLDRIESGRATMAVKNEFSTGEVRRDLGITLRASSGSGSVAWNTGLGVLESLTSSQAVRMAGTVKDMGGGRVELLVRSMLKIERSEEPWSLEVPPAVEENSETQDPDAD